MTKNEIVGRLKDGGLDASSTNRNAAVYVTDAIGGRAEAGWFAYRIICNSEETERMAKTILSRWYDIEARGDVWRLKSKNRIPLMAIKQAGDPGPWMWMMPDIDTTLKIEKRGTPHEVELECSTDGYSWEDCIFEEGWFSKFVRANQKLYIRNKSELSTPFSLGINDRYTFSQTGGPLITCGGDIGSLLCKNPENAVLTPWCFTYLFYLLRIKNTPLLSSANLANSCYRFMFRDCRYLMEVRTKMLTAADNDIHLWLENVETTGDFYCPAELTIPAGSSGIPSGWTRHDI